MTTSAPRLPSGTIDPECEVAPSFRLGDVLRRLLFALGGVVAGSLLLAPLASRIVDGLTAPALAALPEGKQALMVTGAVEAWFAYFKVALYGGLFIAIPWVLFQLWLLVAPRMSGRAKRLGPALVAMTSVVFYAGAAVGYWIILPLERQGTYAMIARSSLPAPMLMLEDVLSHALRTVLGGGVALAVVAMLVAASVLGRAQRQP